MISVIHQKGHAYGVDDGPCGEYQQKNEGRRKIDPRLPRMLTAYHFLSLRLVFVFEQRVGDGDVECRGDRNADLGGLVEEQDLVRL